MSLEGLKYRFSGYKMPMLQLDGTGPNYIQISRVLRHPSLIRQPSYYRKPYYHDNSNLPVKERRKASMGRLYNPII